MNPFCLSCIKAVFFFSYFFKWQVHSSLSSSNLASVAGSTSPEFVLQDMWSQIWSRNREEYSHLLPNDVIPESDIRDPNRTIWVITTACLPWMTGTSINPLLRAAYLARDRPAGKVHLMVPWLRKEEQDVAYTPGVRFNNPEEQRQYVLNWLSNEAQMPQEAKKLNISFYSGRYHDEYHSIFPMGDITALIPEEMADVCILEEPEHLNWYKAPFTAKAWMDKFKHVIGIIHTNYVMYSKTEKGRVQGSLLYLVNQGVCRAYCHKIIKLSGALQEFAAEKEIISNVHGVRNKFLAIGDKSLVKKFSKGAYFVGKMAWPKGLREVFDLMEYITKRMGKCFHLDLYGQGPHLNEIKEAANKLKLPTTFHGAKDHAQLTEYRVFVNPSLSEVLCTTIVEALAMGKWVVCARHPSNEFFEQFPNCLLFSTKEEFAANIVWALHHDPVPLTPELRHALTWEAATDRLIAASMVTKDMYLKSNSFSDKFMAWMFEMIGTGKHGDIVRQLAGAKSAANQIEYVSRFGTATPIPEEEEDITDAEKAEIAESLSEVLSSVHKQHPNADAINSKNE